MLTKSKFMNGLQCSRLMWFANKKQLPEITLSDKHKFAQGSDFEKYVKLTFPEGVDLAGMKFDENLEKTQELIKNKKIIFEAGFQVEDYFVRSDVLEPNGDGWNLYEIKSSTSIKPQHIPDLAFQKFICEKAGLIIKDCFVIVLNKEFVKNGEIDPVKLIYTEEVTQQVNNYIDVEEKAKAFITIINSENVPPITISSNCNKPYSCPLKSECWGTLPKHNVLELTNWRLYWKLFNDGVIEIKDIPNDVQLSDKDQIIYETVTTGLTYKSKEHIKHFLNALNYPLYHFDFETFDTAVPIFNKSKPWQKIPFQFSLHIEQENGETEHHEFLAEGNDDPRPKLLEKMKEVMGTTGDVVVFNQSFEIGRLKELAEDFPEYKEMIQNVLDRIVDLLIPFKKFHYYNPEQKGSASIKKVLPAVTERSYSELEINNGAEASMLFFYSHIKPELENKNEIRENLLKYCGLDTEGMVWIIKELLIGDIND